MFQFGLDVNTNSMEAQTSKLLFKHIRNDTSNSCVWSVISESA